ncbi:helix-turn-helix domain-containing protein [Metapseudomonas otitidis]
MSASVSLKIEDNFEIDQQKLAIPGWVQEYTQMSSGAFRGRTVHAQMGGIEVFEEVMNLRVEQEFHTPPDSLVFSFDMNEETLYLLDEHTRNAWVTPENYRELSVVIKQSSVALKGSSFGVGDLILAPLRFAHCKLFTRWLSKQLADAAKDPSPLKLNGLSEQLLEDCCFILEQGLEAGTRAPRTAHAKAVIQLVLQRINDCPHDSPNVLELARCAGITVRQLQQIFKEYAGLPPTLWLRNRRLNSARRDLLRASTHETTVSEIAMRWSFWHLGRFAETYFSMFGEHPSKTLCRTPGS